MALAFTNVKKGVIGNLGYYSATCTFDNSYPTGGESFTPANAGLDDFVWVGLTADASDTTGAYASWYPIWDDSADKIVVLGGAGATATELDEAANTTDLSALVVYIFALGNIRNQ